MTKGSSMRGAFRRFLLLTLPLALLLAACGDDTEPADEPAAEEEIDTDEEDGEVAASDDACEGVDWPSRTVDYIVPFDPGGGADPVGRQFVERMEEQTEGQWNVANISGGGGTIGVTEVLTEDADGHTLGTGTNSILAFQPLVNPDVAFADHDDWTMIVGMIELPMLLVVRDDAEWETLEDFIEHIDQNPGEVAIGSGGGAGSATDQQVLVLGDEADLDIRSVPYSDGSAASMSALLSGETDADMTNAPSMLGQYEAGEVRVLGVTGTEEYHLFPDAPLFVDLGYEVTDTNWQGVVGPPDIPEDVLGCIRQGALEAVESDEFRDFAEDQGYIHTPQDHEEATAVIQDRMDAYDELVTTYEDYFAGN